jgi:acyl-coenzyme A thioesterase PaaI-like protein
MKMGSDDKNIEWLDDHYCIACGKDNPIGLKLEFVIEGDTIHADWIPDKRFQGYADIVHGGMITLVLDEVMVNLPWRKLGVPVVSAEMTVRLKQPGKIGEKIRFSARMDDPNRKIILTSGLAQGEDGRVIAEATAKCVKVQKSDRLVKPS